MAKLRAACAEDPDFDCLVALALRDAESIEGGLLRDYSLRDVAQALINIATAQAKARERQVARKTFAVALKIAQGIDDASWRAWALEQIAAAQAEAGEQQAANRTFTAAFDAAQDLDTPYDRLTTSASTLSSQAKTGNVHDAIEAFKKTFKARGTRPSEAALRLDRSDRVLVQRGLASLGKEVGAADGVFGQRTRTALRSWQVDAGFKATGHLTREQADRLIAAGRRAAAATETQRLKEFCAEVPQSALCRDL